VWGVGGSAIAGDDDGCDGCAAIAFIDCDIDCDIDPDIGPAIGI
jgi:hypothetical protein